MYILSFSLGRRESLILLEFGALVRERSVSEPSQYIPAVRVRSSVKECSGTRFLNVLKCFSMPSILVHFIAEFYDEFYDEVHN